jgi:hypothetical protein
VKPEYLILVVLLHFPVGFVVFDVQQVDQPDEYAKRNRSSLFHKRGTCRRLNR